MTCKSKPTKSVRNTLNDLTGKEWLLSTGSYWHSEKCADDRDAFEHPAPFLIGDIEKLILMFTKSGMTVLDPFCGSGTTLISAANTGRRSIGIDLSPDYRELACRRLQQKNIAEGADCRYIIGDARRTDVLLNEPVDYIVTSPPYHNILRNNSGGIRKKSAKGYRSGAREGIEYYSERRGDLGNMQTYAGFLRAFGAVAKKLRLMLRKKKYCTIIISDFTVNKRETCVQGDIVRLMQAAGFRFCGTAVLLQTNKPLYPFGYPSAYVINHHHQNMMHFRNVD